MAESATSSISVLHSLFHLISFISFLYIFCWHFGSEAATLPQSQGFGWMFKANRTSCLADDLSCASFTMANVITVMFWCLLAITESPVDQNVQQGQVFLRRPPLWISLCVHLGNVIVAWIDILVSKRRFSKLSLRLALLFGFLYCIWIQTCAIKNKEYPYPFLNELPEPEGLLGMIFVGLLLVLSSFKAGKKASNTFRGACSGKVVKSH
ncbi:uncharacterized protein LOC131047904 isoform X2 [Cryptomeria japonica]|uniref:uncharacterized protein LOC131047904 isoform X2 n=1 Tax=Cryptomeria japonica TaxID=3369 RepID=UPI0025AD07F3|nr:uncharacterized protein LOC131047904 isoform X2 [Cryptomeria japonica]